VVSFSSLVEVAAAVVLRGVLTASLLRRELVIAGEREGERGGVETEAEASSRLVAVVVVVVILVVLDTGEPAELLRRLKTLI